jgi:hypothetical protein
MRRPVYTPFIMKVEGIGSCEIFPSIPESKAEKLQHLVFYMSCLYVMDIWALRRDYRKMYDEEVRDLHY